MEITTSILSSDSDHFYKYNSDKKPIEEKEKEKEIHLIHKTTNQVYDIAV